jgi:hypothetical protein
MKPIHNLPMEIVLGILEKSWLQFSALTLHFSYCIALWHHLLATTINPNAQIAAVITSRVL